MASQPLTWKCFEVEIPTDSARELAYWLSRELGPLDKFGERRDKSMTVRFAAARTDGVMHAYVTYTVIGGWASDLWRAFERTGGPEFDSSTARIREIARFDLEALGVVVPKSGYAEQSDDLWNRFSASMSGLRPQSHAYEGGWLPDGLDDVPPGFRRDGVSYVRTDQEQDGWVWMRAIEWPEHCERRPTGYWMQRTFEQAGASRDRLTWA